VNIKRIFFVIIIFINLSSIFCEEYYRKNIILLEKDVIISNTIDEIIYKETQSALDTLIAEKFINSIPKSEWILYKKYLSDLDNSKNLEKFFLITKVWGIIDLQIINRESIYLIQVRMYDIFDDYFYTKEFYINPADLLNSLTNYKDFIIENIKKYYKPINIKEYSKKVSDKRDTIKENRDFEILLSAGSGFILTNIATTWEAGLGYGFPVYINFDFSFKNFYLATGFSHFSIFNSPLTIDYDKNNIIVYNDKIYTYSINCLLEMGGWFYNRFFLFSGGVRYNFEKVFKFNREEIYNSLYHYYDYKYSYTDMEYSLLFIYLKFIFSPIKNINLSIKCGSFLSPSNINEIFPSNFPFYMEINFKYFFYKDIFLEIISPFWIEGFKFQNLDYTPSIFKFIFQFGFGYRFKWNSKKIGGNR